jgi:hypothetical protein
LEKDVFISFANCGELKRFCAHCQATEDKQKICPIWVVYFLKFNLLLRPHKKPE